jgi:hypothetical protein
MSGTTGDYVIQVGQRFRVPPIDGYASIDQELSEERWLVSWSRVANPAYCTSHVIREWITRGTWIPVEPYGTPRVEPVINLRDKVAEVPHPTMDDEERERILGGNAVKHAADLNRDAKELAWWRTQFATRFPDGELPKPFTALIGKRYHLTEGEHDPGASFCVGIDIGGDSKTVLSVVKDGKVVAFAQLDVVEEVKKVDAYLTNFYSNAARVIDHEVLKIVASLRTGPVPPIVPAHERLSCLGKCGDSVEKRPGEVSWVCAACAQKPVPIADQRWTPRADAPKTCCRIGGEMALDGKTCPLHPAPWVPGYDTFGFSKP